LTPIADQIDQPTGPNGAVATLAATATDIVDGPDPVVFTEGNKVVHSGDTFSIGVHTITASATDEAGYTSSENFIVTIEIDPGPVETVVNVTATHGQSFAASSLFTYSDPFGSAATEYDFWNMGSSGGHFLLNGVTLDANRDNIVTAARLSQLTYQSGSGADTLWVRANDGAAWGPWSQSFTVTAPVDLGPMAVPVRTDVSASHGQSITASALFTASDPFGDAIVEYDFWNIGSGGGHFAVSGQALGASQENYVSAAQLAQTTYQSGSGADMGHNQVTAEDAAP
jgi:hypothetical protein